VRRRTAIDLALMIGLPGLVLAGTAAAGLQVNTDHGKDLRLCRARHKPGSLPWSLSQRQDLAAAAREVKRVVEARGRERQSERQRQRQ
jgi:hypothetical protein